MSRMSDSQRDALLAEPRIAVLSVARETAGPLLAPIWFRYTPAGVFEFYLGASSPKGRRLSAETRASLCIHADDAPYRYVIVEGPVTLTPLGETTKDAVRGMATRYLGERAGSHYAAQFKTPDEVLVTLTPERWQAVIVDGRDNTVAATRSTAAVG